MLELDEYTRRALSQRYGPTADAQARVLAQLRGTLGGPLGPDTGGGEATPPSGTGQVVWMAKICAATAGLTGAGLLVLKLGASVLSSSHESEPAAVPGKVEVSTPTREPPPALAAEPSADLDAASPVTSSAAPPIQTPTKPRASATDSTLTAELVLLDAAERIRSSDPAAALARLDQHRQQFPTGILAPEREALHLEVSCALGRVPATDCRGTGSSKTGD
jgi:hypothetical protein